MIQLPLAVLDPIVPQQALRVLLADDDNEIARQMSRSIEKLGGECKTVCRLEDIVEAAQSWNPSHIILDLIMPGENGITVAQALAKAQVKTPIILTSGAERRLLEAVARSARSHGLLIAGLLPKPFTRAKLAAALGQAGSGQPGGGTIEAVSNLHSRFDPTELEDAIKRGEIRPWLQPQVACRDGQLVGFEALARWHHPRNGIISPDLFIPYAEEHCLIERLTLAMVNQALHWLGSASHHRAATVAFNVTPSLLEDGDFVDKLLASCRRYQVEPARIVLEVTESTKLKQDIATLDRLTCLRLDGFGLSIDDFGIGYSSMLQLAHLPFSEIKIDRSFVSTLTVSEESRAIVASIISLARKLGMTTVAEGVEDGATLQLLKSAGCDRIQGYYFSRPKNLVDANHLPNHFDVS